MRQVYSLSQVYLIFLAHLLLQAVLPLEIFLELFQAEAVILLYLIIKNMVIRHKLLLSLPLNLRTCMETVKQFNQPL